MAINENLSTLENSNSRMGVTLHQNYLKKEFHKLGIKAGFSSIKWDYWQTLLSRGDSRLTDFLIYVYQNGGKNGAYKTALKNLNDTELKAINGFDLEDELPWDIVENYPPKQLLINEFNRLQKFAI